MLGLDGLDGRHRDALVLGLLCGAATAAVLLVGHLAARWTEGPGPRRSAPAVLAAMISAIATALVAAVPVVAVGRLDLPRSLPDSAALRSLVGLAVLAPLAWLVDRALRGAGCALLVATAAGAYACVPDTEHALVVAGAFVAPAVVGLAARRPAPITCWAVWLGVYGWATAIGSRGRPTAAIGSVGALAFLVTGAIAVAIVWRRERTVPLLLLVPIGAAQAAAALASARGPALRDAVGPAFVGLALVVLGTAVVSAVVGLAARSRAHARGKTMHASVPSPGLGGRG